MSEHSTNVVPTDLCPILMSGGKPCGRAVLRNISVGGTYVCLMHLDVPGKDNLAFQAEFDRALELAGTGTADFTGFAFPAAEYAGRKFAPSCLFVRAKFAPGADFSEATFAQDANFHRATFRGPARFEGTQFQALADFSNAEFYGSVEFLRTGFRHDSQGADEKAGSVFTGTKFAKPEDVIFYRTYLGQTLFHLCDVSRINFSNVTWRKRRSGGKRMVFDEKVALSNAEAIKSADGSHDKRNFALIAELYQQLKKNYDDRRDYWTAGDFHYGEMEMKRLTCRRKNPLLRWVKQHFGLAAWYKYASGYGESYRRPAVLLAVVLLGFGLLYPTIGLRDASVPVNAASASQRQPIEEEEPIDQYSEAAQPSSNSPDEGVLTYSNLIRAAGDQNQVKWTVTTRLVGHSLLSAILIAMFQKDLAYEPVYPWGRALMVLEIVLTSTLFALFLLAVRRKFRR